MLSRVLGMGPVENPLIESPFVQQYAVGLGTFPAQLNWLLLDGEEFLTLEGPEFAFLG